MVTYKKKPVIVRELFDADTFAVLSAYMDQWVPILPWGEDFEVFNRLYGHNPPFFVTIHHMLADFASEVFGERVKPSYCFLSMYKNGGHCPLHLDRPQCRYTIDFLLRKRQEKPWPISISNSLSDADVASIDKKSSLTKKECKKIIESHKWTSCELEPNDAVLYSGTNAWHYRPTFSTDNVDLIFFHFVPEDFDGDLN